MLERQSESRQDHISKEALYRSLVEKRKKCRQCIGLHNPSAVDSRFDGNDIGAWSAWQGSLNATILVVGQDWADVDTYLDDEGKDGNNNPTNRNLVKLLNSIDINVKGPENWVKNDMLFFTNAILCLKEGDMQADTRQEWYDNCVSRFLRPLMDIIGPQVVIALGKDASYAIIDEYGIAKPFKSFRQIVESPYGIKLSDTTTLFPVYHCGAKSVNMNRNMARQIDDWKKIGAHMKSTRS